jgi:hypothetical protein
MKIYVCSSSGDAQEKGKTWYDETTQFTTKIDGFLSFIPPWMLMYDQTHGSGAVFFLFHG